MVLAVVFECGASGPFARHEVQDDQVAAFSDVGPIITVVQRYRESVLPANHSDTDLADLLYSQQQVLSRVLLASGDLLPHCDQA